ncbi:MAG: hypothetical protein NTW29_10265 [Bacteroidetes bacterium]|nr:hypothetical protein [Bacteroidota bacterium]
MSNTLSVVLIAIITLTVMVLLFFKNRRDKKRMDPDAPDSVETTIMDKQRRKDRI